MGIIATLIIGAIAGWLGGIIYKGSGLGLIGNIMDWCYLDRSYWSYCYFILDKFDI